MSVENPQESHLAGTAHHVLVVTHRPAVSAYDLTRACAFAISKSVSFFRSSPWVSHELPIKWVSHNGIGFFKDF